MKKITKIIAISLAALSLSTFVGCKKKASDANQGQITVRAVTKGSPAPYIVQDENGNLDGYDIAVFKAVFERLPQYKLDLIISADALTGLLSGQYDISVNNWSYNEKRAESYYFSYPYDKVIYDFIQRKRDEPLTSFQDIADRGYSIEVSAGNNITNALERWNEANPDSQIKLVYTESDLLVTFQHIQDGISDFRIDDNPIIQKYKANYGLEELSFNPLPDDQAQLISSSLYAFFLFPKDEKGAALREDVNKALKSLYEDGTLNALSEKYFGANQVPGAENFTKTVN